jgi:hypothetical protein
VNKRLMILGGLIGVLAGFQNCSGVDFSSVQASSSNNVQTVTPPGGPTCSTVIQNYSGDLRVIVMVDDSGSTATTDPQYQVREATLEAFIAKYSAKTNFTYAFGEFAKDQASVYDEITRNFVSSSSGTFGANQISPFGGSADLTDALNLFVTIPNKGDTPYGIGVKAITNIIQNDITTGLLAPVYSVIFMSDGMPDPNEDVPTLQSHVQSVLAAAVANNNSMATFSTVYFGPESSPTNPQLQQGTPENNLYEMSLTGNGQYYDTNHPPPGGLIENVLTIPGQTQVCTQAKRFWNWK